MARIVSPLTDVKYRQAKYSAEATKKLFDGGGLYLELMPSGAKKWQMKFRQANSKENVLTFGDYLYTCKLLTLYRAAETPTYHRHNLITSKTKDNARSI